MPRAASISCAGRAGWQRATKGDLLGVHVRAGEGLSGPPPELLQKHREVLEDLGGTYHEVAGADPAATLVSFARSEHATQLVLGSSRRSRWSEIVRGSVINRSCARRAISTCTSSRPPRREPHGPRVAPRHLARYFATAPVCGGVFALVGARRC